MSTNGAPTPNGFADKALHSAWTFRAILEAMSRPGRIQAVSCDLDPPEPLYPAAAAVALTLFDLDTPVWLDAAMRRPDVVSFLRFHCGCPIIDDPAGAAFALAADPNALPPLDAFAPGTPEYPDRSTTLIVQCTSLGDVGGVDFTGPGIESVQALSAPSLSLEFWHRLRANNARYPLGIDTLFVTARAVAGCPRSSEIDIHEAA